MLHSRSRTIETKARRTVNRWAIVVGLVVLSLFVISSISFAPRSAGAASDRARNGLGNAERVNYRVRAHAPSSVAASAPMLAPIDVDRTDDDAGASQCTPLANDCSLRGAVSFANLAPGTTINVPAGTYQLTISGAGEGFAGNNAVGDLDISGNNTTISGAGAGTTTIQQTTANDRVIEVNPFLDAAFTTSISGVTISGGKETTGIGGGGIISGAIGNSLTVTNCTFSGNSASGAGTFGGGGISHAGGDLTITGSTFTNNTSSASGGAVGYSAGDPLGRTPSTGTLSVSGSTFSTNTANSAAAGGGALDLFDFNLSASTYSVNSSSFSGNTAPNGSGGAIIVESGPLTVTTSSLSGNSAANLGGAIFSAGSGSISFSRLVGNTATNGLSIFRANASFTANDNWWGINTGPAANDFVAAGGSVSPATYLQLRITASPNTVCAGGTSSLTADIKQRNTGSPLTTELNGLPAFPVPPGTIFNNAVLGTLSGASTQFVDGVATATYTAGGTAGAGSADATADNQTVTATITISANNTTDPADVTVCQGQDANFSTSASGPGPFSYAWTLDGNPFNGDSPSITVPTGSLSFGSHTVTVTVTGGCNSVSQSATLTVQENTVASDPADVTVCQGATANFSTTASGADLHYAWTLDGSPFNGDSPSINVPTGALSVGAHTIGLTVTGTCGTVNHTATLTVQANTVASDPADVTVCQGATANFSTNASGEDIHYAWTLDGSPFNGDSSSINVPTGSLSIGNHTVGLTVTGDCGVVNHTATLTVQAPTATTDPADVTACQGQDANFSTTASGTGPFSYAWTLDGNPVGGNNPSVTIPTGSLSPGSHTVQVTTTGTCGSAVQTATLTVGGAPVITLTGTMHKLWPPNHQYNTFNISDFVSSASSTCDPMVDVNDVKILNVSSDEPENSSGADGNTLNDIVIAPDCKSVQLRAERDGNLNGRVYTITFKVTDQYGNSTTATATVTAPKNHNDTAVDDGPAAGYTVISLCP